MKSKLNYLIHVSIMRKVKTKWFVIANVLLLLAIIALANIDTIITRFGGDFDRTQQILVIDNTGFSYEIFKGIAEEDSEIPTFTTSDEYEMTLFEGSYDDAIEKIEEDTSIWLIVFDESEDEIFDVTVVTNDYLSTIRQQTLYSAINNVKITLALLESDIDMEELTEIYSPVEIERVYLEEERTQERESTDALMGVLFPFLILPFFMLSIFLIQMIGAEVNDEKSTRGMEIIISNVSPTIHFFSKVIAGNLFIFGQAILLFIYGLMGLGLRLLTKPDGDFLDVGVIRETYQSLQETGALDRFIFIIPLTLLLMALTLIAYSLLAGILASMTTNIEDFQQLQTPIVFLSLGGFYLAMLAPIFAGSTFIQVISYIPFLSAILAPSLLVIGQGSILDVLISTVIICITIFVLIKYGLKVYKVGILNYSSNDLWKKMFKALKTK